MNPFQKRFLFGTSALTALPGAVYWWMEHMLEPERWPVALTFEVAAGEEQRVAVP